MPKQWAALSQTHTGSHSSYPEPDSEFLLLGLEIQGDFTCQSDADFAVQWEVKW